MSTWTCGGEAHVRPDGDQLRTLGYYNRDDGLGMGVVNALLLDTDGTIWAGGKPDPDRPPPLSHFDGKPHSDGNPWRRDEPLVEALARQPVKINIQSLLRSRDGALWIGLYDDGILRWDGRAWSLFGQSQGDGRPGDASQRIRRLFQDSSGTIWAAASRQGLLRFDAGQQRWTQVNVTNDNIPIHEIAQLADGSLWASGDRVIVRSTDGGRSWVVMGTGDVIGVDIGALVQDGTGRVWAGAYDGGVILWDGGTWRALQR